MDTLKKYRKQPVFKAYKVSEVVGSAAPWRVDFYVDGETVGGGQYHTHQQAEDSGLDFMFSGWGDD